MPRSCCPFFMRLLRPGLLAILVYTVFCLASSFMMAQETRAVENRDWIPYTDSRKIRVDDEKGQKRPLTSDELLALAARQSSVEKSMVILSFFNDAQDRTVYLAAQQLKEEGANITMWVRGPHNSQNPIFILIRNGEAWHDEPGFRTEKELRTLVEYIRRKYNE